MDHYSILDQSPAPSRPQAEAPPSSAIRPPSMSVSAAIAAVNAKAGPVLPPAKSGLDFPGDDGGQSLAEMAQRDLDAALQLLADRAQYITGASGAAIALRRGDSADMLCRASSGANAPELGALLSAEFGLSGESVRTRLPLRCDDTERDPRVNREGCRQLGIASVVVMPIVSDDQVLGVFELFSGRVSAFAERDISALQRLGEMVETAVKLSHPARSLPAEILAGAVAEEVQGDVQENEETPVEVEVAAPEVPEVAAAVSEARPKPAAAKRPLLWSAALQAGANAQKPAEADQSHVPPGLRSLKKCHACGFPVSEGRLLCVECEEKKWRGQLRSSMAATPSPSRPAKLAPVPTQPAARAETVAAQAAAPAKAPVAVAAERLHTAPGSGSAPEFTSLSSAPESSAPERAVPQKAAVPEAVLQPPARPEPSATASEGTPFSLSAGIGSSESWLSANKYILGAILLVGAVIAVISYLR
jgi:GAF domain-containing protein